MTIRIRSLCCLDPQFQLASFQQNIVMLTTLFYIVSNVWLIPSTILLFLIHQYIKKKPPGLQSVLDLLILILLKVTFGHNIVSAIARYFEQFEGQLDTLTAKFVLFLLVNGGVLQVACLQALLIVKAILIFKPHWIADQMDSAVIRKSALFVVSYTSARFLLDFNLTESRTSNELKLLTVHEVET